MAGTRFCQVNYSQNQKMKIDVQKRDDDGRFLEAWEFVVEPASAKDIFIPEGGQAIVRFLPPDDLELDGE